MRKYWVGLLFIIIFCWLLVGREEKTAWPDLRRQCQKQDKIVFLKTHKTASSTVQNIFLRFGEINKLNFVLPAVGWLLPGYFSRRMIQRTPWEQAGMEYNILCLHTRWNEKGMVDVMGNGTKYITILRDPVDLFESQWGFYNFDQKYGMSLEEFAVANKTGKLSRVKAAPMLWDLGLNELDDIQMVKQKIEEIERNFDLVMIVEKFEESLILMKDELCWDTSDITSLKLNGRIEDVKINLNSSMRSLLKDYLKSDYLLYNHFLNIFNNKIEEFGKQRMADEQAALSAANSEISEQCIHSPSDKLVGDPRKSWGGKGLLGYDAGNKTNEDCTRMVERERDYVGRLQNIQKEKLKSGHLE